MDKTELFIVILKTVHYVSSTWWLFDTIDINTPLQSIEFQQVLKNRLEFLVWIFPKGNYVIHFRGRFTKWVNLIRCSFRYQITLESNSFYILYTQFL